MNKRFGTNYIILLLVFFPFLTECKTPAAPKQKDVIKIMSYNVLKYGDGCQGTANEMHAYLKTIINYTDPDILGLVKVEAIPTGPNAKGKAPIAFEDSILAHALNAARADLYARLVMQQETITRRCYFTININSVSHHSLR